MPPTRTSVDNCSRERIRLWLRQCESLHRAGALGPDAVWVVRFAIRWAPFGGASAGDLLETFGVTPSRFLQLLREALDPSGTTDSGTRTMKSRLGDALLCAWTNRA